MIVQLVMLVVSFATDDDSVARTQAWHHVPLLVVGCWFRWSGSQPEPRKGAVCGRNDLDTCESTWANWDCYQLMVTVPFSSASLGCGGAEDIGGGVWTSADMLVEFGAGGAKKCLGRVGDGSACSWPDLMPLMRVHVRWSESLYRPREVYVRPGISFKDFGDVGEVARHWCARQRRGRVVRTLSRGHARVVTPPTRVESLGVPKKVRTECHWHRGSCWHRR